MSKLRQYWQSWMHTRKFAKAGRHNRFPVPRLFVEGHVEIGDNCRFRDNVTLRTHGGGKIIFGNRCGCSWGCFLDAHLLIRFGNYVGIAEYTYLCDSMTRLYGDDASWKDAQVMPQPIVLEDDCFIGSNCVICAGVTVGEGAVIAPYSVLMHSVAPFEIWGGVPARRVGHRTEGVPETKLQEYRELVSRYGFQKDRYKE